MRTTQRIRCQVTAERHLLGVRLATQATWTGTGRPICPTVHTSAFTVRTAAMRAFPIVIGTAIQQARNENRHDPLEDELPADVIEKAVRMAADYWVTHEWDEADMASWGASFRFDETDDGDMLRIQTLDGADLTLNPEDTATLRRLFHEREEKEPTNDRKETE